MNPAVWLFSTRNVLAPIVLRFAFVALYLFHGGQKFFGLFGGNGLIDTWESMTTPEGMNLSVTVAAIVLAGEALIPFFLLLGLAVRLASLGIIAQMVLILTTLYSGLTLVEQEFPLFVIAAAFALLISGAGSFSLDHKISRAFRPDESGVGARQSYLSS